jgi:transcriptional regulator with XRE-family HTH domain
MRSKTAKKDEISLPTHIVSERIETARLKKGYKQDFMANQLGISERAYQNIESNSNKNISITRVQEIANILEIDWLSLLSPQDKITQIHTGDNSPNSNNVYNSNKDLVHENEKLQLKNEFLEKENSNLQEIIRLMKEQKS